MAGRRTIIRQRYIKKLLSGQRVFCGICGEQILAHEHEKLTIDHKKPKSLGGTDSVKNLQPAHWECNQAKADAVDYVHPGPFMTKSGV